MQQDKWFLHKKQNMLILSIIINIILLYIAIVNFSKNEKLLIESEKYLNDLEKENDNYFNIILSIRSRVRDSLDTMRTLDRIGAFESDDEVGYFFKELKKIVNDISLYFDVEDQNETNQQQDNIRSVITERF
jgi:hypothetical protein